MEKLIIELSEIFEMNPDDIRPFDKFKEYKEWSSLVQLSLIAIVNENYGRVISKQDFEKMNTIQDIFNFINV